MIVTRWTSRSGSNHSAAPMSPRQTEKTTSRWGPLKPADPGASS